MPIMLPVDRVLAICNPLDTSPWTSMPVTKDMISSALKNGRFVAQPIPMSSYPPAHDHAARIAYLIETGWSDAIDIDVGIPSMGCYVDWPVTDGNHRLAAAAYRGDAMILANVGGSMDYVFDLFGIDCQEYFF